MRIDIYAWIALLVGGIGCTTDNGDGTSDEDWADVDTTDAGWIQDGLRSPLQEVVEDRADVIDGTTVIMKTGNLLGNGGFELGEADSAPPWIRSAGVDSKTAVPDIQNYIFRSAKADHAGTRGLRIHSGADLDQFANAFQKLHVIAGRSYTVSAETRLINGDQQFLYILVFGDWGDQPKRVSYRSGWSTSWHKIGGTFTVPDGSRELWVAIGDGGSDVYGSTHDWDGLKLFAN